MKRKRRDFPSEFKEEAVNLVLEAGMGISEVAADLDVGRSSLYNWVKQAEADRGSESRDCITTSEHEELRRLRRENRILKEERLILKKAAAFFAKESQ